MQIKDGRRTTDCVRLLQWLRDHRAIIGGGHGADPSSLNGIHLFLLTFP
jgi:hypothetical protein